jgi:hypothetical protein
MSAPDSTSTELPPKIAAAIKTEEARYRGKPYEMTDKGLLWWKPGREGAHVPTLLANFTAEIVEDVMVDDGVETSRAFKIEATLGKRVRTFTVSQTQFGFMNWPSKHLGARANVYPGHEGHTRSAIIDLSKYTVERYLYRQTGWREIDGKQVYLHAGGGIGSNGTVKVDTQLHSTLGRYHLPSPRRRPEIVKAVRASMRMLDIAPDRIMVPIFSGIWRAILQNCMFSIHIAGPTGAGKSQIAALAQQHFGAKMDGDHLPLSWSGTANAIRELMFQCKDAIIVVDDFVPTGSSADVQRLHGTAEQVMRAQGNHSSRARMTADTSIRPAKEPRGLLLSTGEDTPGTQSLRARQVIIELSKGELSWLKLTECQSAAAAGHYAMAMAGFVRWIAPRLPKVEAMMQKDLTEFRNATAKLPGAHRRTPDNICSLATGFRMWLTFAQAVKAIQADQASMLWERACQAFQDLIDCQSREQEVSDPARQFIGLIAALFAGGKGHLASEKGAAPPQPARWGWTRTEDGIWTAQGPKVGWYKDGNVFLDPHNAFAAAQSLGKEIGEGILISLTTLQRRLKQAGLLASWDENREVNTVRLQIEGSRRNVLHFAQFSADTLYGYKKPDHQTVSATGTFGRPTNWQEELENPTLPDPHPTAVTNAREKSSRKVVGLVRFPKGIGSLSARAVKRSGPMVGTKNGTIPTTTEPDHKSAYKSAAERREEELAKL